MQRRHFRPCGTLLLLDFYSHFVSPIVENGAFSSYCSEEASNLGTTNGGRFPPFLPLVTTLKTQMLSYGRESHIEPGFLTDSSGGWAANCFSIWRLVSDPRFNPIFKISRFLTYCRFKKWNGRKMVSKEVLYVLYNIYYSIL